MPKPSSKQALAAARQLVVGGSHEHLGARAVPNHATKDLECAFCGGNVGAVRVSDAEVEVRRMPLFNAMSTPVTSAWTDKIDARCAKLAKLAAGAAVGTEWDNASLGGRSPKPADSWGPSPSERAGQAVFARILAAGEDWLGAVRAELAGPLAPAAVSLLSLREPCRAAWQFNPSVPVDAAAIQAFEAFRAGQAPSFLVTYPELEVARFELLLTAWADPRAEVQDAAVIAISGGGQGFGSPADERARWAGYSADQKLRAFARYDEDAAAKAAGTLATTRGPWREGRLVSIGRLVDTLRA